MTQSSIALLTLAHAHHHDTEHEPEATVPESQRPLDIPNAPSGHAASSADRTAELSGDSLDGSCDGADLEALATLICEQDPGGRRDPATVAAVLAHRYVDGWSASRVARELGRSRSAVSRILRDAERLRAHVPIDRAHAGAELSAQHAHDDEDRAHTDPDRAHEAAEPRGNRAHTKDERVHADRSPASTEPGTSG
ncbi:helix-turn-helix domain-containing protein [Nocardia sp. NPDC087230]|uniref:helix-turn-helix domain-containing protein n=1 Tax=Nocardia sp. NPDC087230 TaxID=3364331 RepID=UPI003820D131